MSKKEEALKLALECVEKLWNIIDDIDTYGDMAKADEKLCRSLVERRQRTRFEETGISADGYKLDGGAIDAIREALAEQARQQEPIGYIAGFEWETRQSEMVVKVTRQPQPEHGFVRALYTSPQPPQHPAATTCTWHQQDNKMNFCPFCSKPLAQASVVQDDDPEF